MKRKDYRQFELVDWINRDAAKEGYPLRQRLIDEGFAHDYALHINRGLMHDGGEGIINSRLCRYPVFYECVDGHERVVLRHPDLADQPLPTALRAAGHTLMSTSPKHPHTIDGLRMHAQDLVNDRGVESGDLFRMWSLTTSREIYTAIRGGLEYGDLSPPCARQILAFASASSPAPEPQDRSADVLANGMIAMIRDDLCELEWCGFDIVIAAWGALHALEDGWVKRAKSHGLQITAKGRDRIAALK